MAILNLTPDSFSGDGQITRHGCDPKQNLETCRKFVRDGADIIDVGGESTRPGAKAITEAEEIRRTIPTVSLLAKRLTIPVSIDTYKENVARHALDAGASIVNNIAGVKATSYFLKMVRNYDAAIVLMHIRGTPQTMQKNIYYKNLISDILRRLQKSIEKCLEIGIKSDKIIIDPGIGFGKTVEHNMRIIKELEKFRTLKKPILIGVSRKSFIGKILNRDVAERLPGTIAATCASVMHGAHMIRAHDIKETKDALTLTDLLLK